MKGPTRAVASMLASFALLGATASAASAGALVGSAANCDSQSLSQPFLPWADPMHYVIAPGGDFEGSAWSSTGGASVVEGNEPFHVGGAHHASSLALPSGSTATSGAMCVSVEHPTIRFFARQTGGDAGARVNVDVLFQDATGANRTLRVAAAPAGSDWAPSAAYPIVVNLLTLGDRTSVRFRVSATGGDFRIDDFYVDPYNRG